MKRKVFIVAFGILCFGCEGTVKIDEKKLDTAGAKLQRTVEEGADSIGAKLERLKDKLDTIKKDK
jgi:hypothetical protein